MSADAGDDFHGVQSSINVSDGFEPSAEFIARPITVECNQSFDALFLAKDLNHGLPNVIHGRAGAAHGEFRHLVEREEHLLT
jgi:hypothetical protein